MLRSVLFLSLALAASAQTTPSLRLSQTELDFVALFSGDSAAPQVVTITSSDPARAIRFTVSTDNGTPGVPAMGWLAIRSISPGGSGSFTTPARLVVTADPTFLAAADYRARIRIQATDASPSDIAIPVKFSVDDAPPQLEIRPSILKFTVRPREQDSQVQGLVVRNAGGGGPLPVSAFVQPFVYWLTVSLGAQSTAANTAVPVRVALNPQGLAPGLHRTEIRFSGAPGQPLLVIPVSVLVLGDAPFLSTNPAGVQFEMRQGSGTTVARAITVFNLGGGTASWSAQVVEGSDWLALSGSTGNTVAGQSGSFTATVYTRSLTPRFYYALIRLTAPGATNSPYLLPVTLNVLPSDQSANPAPSPSGLIYVATENSPAFSQKINVFTSSQTPVRYQLSSATTDRRGWLSAGGGPGVTSTDSTAGVDATVNPAVLTPGVYYGEINVATSTDEVRTVNITAIIQPRSAAAATDERRLEGCTPTEMSAVHTGLVSNFRTPAGWPVPLTVRVLDNCGEAVTNAQVVATFSNGDPALPMRLANANGSYSTTWAPSRTGTQTTVTARIAAPGLRTTTAEITGGISESKAPVLSPGGTLNNFSFSVGAPVAPGTVVSMFGNDLAPQLLSAPTVPLPNEINRTLVLINGAEAPLYFVSPQQVGAQIPVDLPANRSYQILVAANGAFSLPDTIEVSAARPGLLVKDGAAIAQRADGSFVSDAAPAKPGETLVLYLVGMGPTDPAVASGTPTPATQLHRTVTPATVRVGGQNANVAFAGLSPFFVGLYQVNFTVPSLPAGNHDLTVIQDNVSSNTGTLPVRP